MLLWINRLLLVALFATVAVLTITALPSLGGDALSGSFLFAHMLASGALVVGLPVLAVVFVWQFPGARSRAAYWGYLATILTGIATIATVFLCMLPIPSTEQMHELIEIHGWAGFAMIPAAILLALGMRAAQAASAAS